MSEFLSLVDEYNRNVQPGKKKVRWADIEERRDQEKKRAMGFVVGQTQEDWERMTGGDSYAERALKRTKFF